jgi:hypothetical protein
MAKTKKTKITTEDAVSDVEADVSELQGELESQTVVIDDLESRVSELERHVLGERRRRRVRK